MTEDTKVVPDTLLVMPTYDDDLELRNLSDDVFVVSIDDPEQNTPAFEDSIQQGAMRDDWEFIPVGSVSIPIYKVVKR